MTNNTNINGVGGIYVNISPEAFHLWATHYYKCKKDFKSPNKFSPVPYFLLCRSIELELKSRHLKNKNQSEVKNEFGHDLLEAYSALSPAEKILEQNEEYTLQVASDIYKTKGFEYFNPQDALTGYNLFPDLIVLNSIANKLIEPE